MKTNTYIESVKNFTAGGNNAIDLITLVDGKVLSITSECVVLHHNMKEFEDSLENLNEAAQFIDLTLGD